MEFQVQENVKPTLLKIADNLRTKQRKHLFANFQTAISRIDTINKGQRGVVVIVIKRNNNRRISNYAGSGGSNRRHDQPFSSMGAQRRGTDKRPAFYLPAVEIDRIDFLSCLTEKLHGADSVTKPNSML